MQTPELRSPFARAVLPVLGGLALLAAIAGFTWGIASFISRGGAEGSDRLAPRTFTIGNVESLSDEIAESGPLYFPELGTAIGTRSIVVNHEGDDPRDGWRVYWGYPADRPAACVVEQVPGTPQFTDCDGRTLDVTELSPPDAGVLPRVEDQTLIVDLRGAIAAHGPAGAYDHRLTARAGVLFASGPFGPSTPGRHWGTIGPATSGPISGTGPSSGGAR